MFSRLLDITKRIEDGMEVWPGDPEVTVREHFNLTEHGYAVSRVCFGTHTGTHVDFPGHIMEGAPGPELDAFIGTCVVVEASRLDILLSSHGKLPSRILIKGGLPSFSQASSMLAKGARLIGVEHPSIDEEGGLDLHNLLLRGGAVILEGLDLSQADEGPAFLLALPLLIKAMDGAPARAVLAYD